MSLHPRKIDMIVQKIHRSGIQEGDLSLMKAVSSGDRWFVDNSLSASGDGKTWANAFITIAEAISAASANDIIAIAPGTFTITTTLSITTNGIKLIGSGGMHSEATLITGAVDLLDIDAANVEIAGIAFEGTTNAKDCINLSGTNASKNVHIHDCMFIGGGSGKAEYGIACDSTRDQENLVVENCFFEGFDTVALQVNATNALIRNNLIKTIASKVGIEHVPTTTARPGSLYLDNLILGVDSTDTGIKITGTPGKGLLGIYGNRILGCATTITQKANNAFGVARNYDADINGGVIIDPVA